MHGYACCCCHADLSVEIRLVTMPKAAGSLWADCLKALPTLVDVPFETPAFSAAANQVFRAMSAMDSLPLCKATEWTVIVHKLKVRRDEMLERSA
jgi:hypothetical protein